MKRKMPPYAKDFKPIYLAQDCQVATIYCDWSGKGKGIVLPPNERPSAFYWNFLKNCYVIVRGDIDLEMRQELANELGKIGAIQVRFILPQEWRELYKGTLNWSSEHEIYG